ncbi:MAG: M48 family metallopeptidase [Anaerolineales bacterium]
MFRSRIYRVDNEQVVLALTIVLVVAIIILTSTVTFCVSGIFIILMFALSAVMIRSHHQSLMREAYRVEDLRSPELGALVEECNQKLQPGVVDVYVVNKNQMNAYTFGISSPKVLVLYTPLLKVLTPGELKFILGHEMGHVALGHTWLNTIVGGLAGIPAPFGAAILLYAAFRWWNRMCEFSADRAGLLACGDLNLAVAALVKLVAPEVRTQREFEQALALIDAEDDEVSNRLVEAFQSHPMLIRRINELRDYSKTEEYQALQTGVYRNVGVYDDHRHAEENSTIKDIARPIEEKQPPKKPEERWPWLKPRE